MYLCFIYIIPKNTLQQFLYFQCETKYTKHKNQHSTHMIESKIITKLQIIISLSTLYSTLNIYIVFFLFLFFYMINYIFIF